MSAEPRATDRTWIAIVAHVPWWGCVALAVAAYVLIGRLAPDGSISTGAAVETVLVEALRTVATLSLLVAAAASAWGRAREAALREVDVALPSEADLMAAREAGRQLGARGLIGLVLAGGGAKGAYQVGCWRALRACGVSHFGAIAGTSVGALNAVLVAQDDFDKAESIWREMSFGRVLRLRWHAVAAVAIRIVLIVPYAGKLLFPARAIPVTMWRAVRDYRTGWREGDPRRQVAAALALYRAFLDRPTSTDMVANVVLAALALAGLSAWWVLAAPVLTVAAMVVVAPLAAFFLVAYISWFVTFLDQLSTRLVLVTNEPLHQLLMDCVDVDRLRATAHPLLVTLARLGEVTRTVAPNLGPRKIKYSSSDPKAGPPSWWKRNITGEGPEGDYTMQKTVELWPIAHEVTTVEYLPTHFDVRLAVPDRMRELILQSAGLPEIFPARRIDNETFVDGGIVDNVPLAALADVAGHAAIIVMPLDAELDEAAVRKAFLGNLTRLRRTAPVSLPELCVLTPSRPLGGFLTGTLDFGARRAQALMHQGYCDTIRYLARGVGHH